MPSGRSSSRRGISAGPVAVEEPDEPDFPLLRMAGGEHQRLRALELPAQRLVLALRRLDHLVVQGVELVLHLAERRAHRAFERRVDLRHDRASAPMRSATSEVIPASACSTVGGSWLWSSSFSAFSSCGCSAVDRQVVLAEEAQRRRIDQRRGGALVHQRHRNAEVGVDLAQLAQVGQLVRARDVTDGGEDRVLDERPQQDVRAEVLRDASRRLRRARPAWSFASPMVAGRPSP